MPANDDIGGMAGMAPSGRCGIGWLAASATLAAAARCICFRSVTTCGRGGRQGIVSASRDSCGTCARRVAICKSACRRSQMQRIGRHACTDASDWLQ